MNEAGPVTIPIRNPRPVGAERVRQKLQRLARKLSPSNAGLCCTWIGQQLRLKMNWWLRPHTPYQAVFVVATTRSGSNLLLTYLGQLPGVCSYAEVLNWGTAIGPRRKASARRALLHIRQSLHPLRAARRACKVFLDELNHYRLNIDDLAEAFPDSRFVILYRQSLAEQYASLQLAQQTRQWVLREGEQQQSLSIAIEPDSFRKYCDKQRRSYHGLLATSWLAQRSVLLSYEELTANPSLCLRERICPLLEVPAIEPVTRLCKQNPQPLALRVANYRQVAALLASPFSQQHYTLHQHRVLRAA